MSSYVTTVLDESTSTLVRVAGPTQVTRVTEGMPGAKGDPGNTGPPGGTAGYHHVQGSPSTVWTINHGLGMRPAVTCFDSSLDVIEGDIVHVSIYICTVTFAYTTSGTAELS